MADAYTYETDVAVRFRDFDAMNQVHNAVFLVYVEEARSRYFRDVLGVELGTTNGAIVHQEIDYYASITCDSAVTVRYRVEAVGESSLTMAFEIHGDEGKAADGKVVHVVLDGDDHPQGVPEDWRTHVREFEEASVGGV